MTEDQEAILRAIQAAVRAGNRYITVHATQEAVSDGIDPRRLPDAIIWDAAELIENIPGIPEVRVA